MKPSDYLTPVAPDYDELFPVTPQRVMTFTPKKNQTLRFSDSGAPRVSSRSDTVSIEATLKFQNLTETNANLIIDWWADAAKANGMMRSFKIQNLAEAEQGYYTARFASPELPESVYSWGQRQFTDIPIIIEGTYTEPTTTTAE